jgi:hypothetical protein
MIVGNFEDDLNIFLDDNKGRSGASKASTTLLEGAGIAAKGPLEQGRMYTFRYFTEDETFYDTYPIVIGLGKSFGLNQLGINLHYIPYDYRISFVKDIVRSFSGIFESQLKYAGEVKNQMYMKDFTYDAIKQSLGKKYNLTYAIRQYRMDRMKKPRVLGYEDWYLGAVNDSNFFFGGSINEAQALYNKNI